MNGLNDCVSGLRHSEIGLESTYRAARSVQSSHQKGDALELSAKDRDQKRMAMNTVGIMIIAMLKAFNDDPLSVDDQVSIFEQSPGEEATDCLGVARGFPVLPYVFLLGIKVLFCGANRSTAAHRLDETEMTNESR